MKDYLALTKPRITWLILMSTGIGYFFGLRATWNLLALVHTLLGTALLASGTAALNQWYERNEDAQMRRTQDRPLPQGRIAPPSALLFGLALSLGGFLELWLGVNLLAAVLGALTLAMYLLLYTPLKKRSPLATTVGAFPGAMPPLIGYAASSGTLTAEAWALYAILFLWQFPHFLSIAWMYRADYERAGIRMLPVVEPEGRSTALRIALYSLALVPVSLAPTFLSMTGRFYLAGALLLGSLYFFSGVRLLVERSAWRARQVLLASVLYLPLLYGLMLLDRPRL